MDNFELIRQTRALFHHVLNLFTTGFKIWTPETYYYYSLDHIEIICRSSEEKLILPPIETTRCCLIDEALNRLIKSNSYLARCIMSKFMNNYEPLDEKVVSYDD